MVAQDAMLAIGTVQTASANGASATILLDGAATAVNFWPGSTDVDVGDRLLCAVMRGELYAITTRLQNDYLHTVGNSGEPAYQNSWVKYQSGAPGARYWMDESGVVHLSGQVGGGTATNTTIFTLPAAFRPAQNLTFVSTSSGGTIATIQVNSDGTVVMARGSLTWVTLEGISWIAGV